MYREYEFYVRKVRGIHRKKKPALKESPGCGNISVVKTLDMQI